MGVVTIKRGREKSLLRRHPWIFSGAVAGVKDVTENGSTVTITTCDGARIGRGAYSQSSQIRVRVWSFDPEEEIDAGFFGRRLAQAKKIRDGLFAHSACNAYRLINSESDGLPGVIVDRYADFLVCQFLSAGAEYRKAEIVGQLTALFPGFHVFERSDADVRKKEGLAPTTGALAGNAPPDLLEIREGDLRFLVDVRRGHKTGFYLDQRDNRRLLADFTGGAKVLNCFAYTGGFGVWALHGGATDVINIDSSAEAAALTAKNVALNGFDPVSTENRIGDVFVVLRQFRDAGRKFDTIVLDPPKFVSSAGQISGACRGYKDINLLAFKLLHPGGSLFTFSCSGHMPPELFQKIVADAALDAGRDVRILRQLGPAPDHPVGLNFPEGAYLKGLFCRVAE